MKTDGASSLTSLKYKNRHMVLEYIRQNDNMSMADIAKATGLSKMTVHYIVDHLLKTKKVIHSGKGESTDEGGKKPRLFSFNSLYRYIFSVRIVEQEMRTVLTNLRGEIMASHTALYGKDISLDEILRLIREAFISLTRRQKVAIEDCLGVVMGCHGIFDVDRGICVLSPHFLSWGTNVPVCDRVRELLPPGIPVYIDNWLRYHTYSEMKARGGQAQSFFLIGTEYDGLAGGLVIDGGIYHGESGLSGEIGHMIVDPASLDVCVCGGVGCFEVAVSPRRMEDKARSMRKDWRDSILFCNKSHRDVSFYNIVKASNSGDELACILVDGAVKFFAVAINNLVHICDPGLVIIQGEYAKAGDYFLKRLHEQVNHLTLLRMNKSIRIEYSYLDDDCSLSGAACYVTDKYFESMLNE